MSEKIIEIKHLAKHYGTFKAVEDVSFDVYQGDVFGFLGPNGAGKSTTIRTMLTLIAPTAGELFLFGKNIKEHRNYILSKIGCIVEKPDFYKYLSAYKNLEIFGRISGAAISRKKIYEMLEFVGLRGREKDKVEGYSHGMRQRLGIAQTLLHDPQLIILDEPNTGLDPQGIIDIRVLISQLKTERNKTIVLSSHILSEIELIANRMVIINKGRSIVTGLVEELLNREELVVHIEVSDVSLARNFLDPAKIIASDTESSDNIIRMHIAHADIPKVNHALINAGIGVYSIESKRRLEDYFLKLVNQ